MKTDTTFSTTSQNSGTRSNSSFKPMRSAAILAAGMLAVFSFTSCETTGGGNHGGPGGGYFPGNPGNGGNNGGGNNGGGDNGGGNNGGGNNGGGNDGGGNNGGGNNGGGNNGGGNNGGGNNGGGYNPGPGGMRPDIDLIPDRLKDLINIRDPKPGLRPPGGAQPDPSPIDSRPGFGNDMIRNPGVSDRVTMPGGPRVTTPVSRGGGTSRMPRVDRNIGSRVGNIGSRVGNIRRR